MKNEESSKVCGDRLLVFGGPYSNRQATEALLERAAALSIPSSAMLCTGDLVAYCAEPQATVDLIRQAGIATVMGNCEESLANDSDDCGCGFSDGSLCDLLSVEWYNYSRARLDDNSKAWMGALPRSIRVTIGNRRLLAVHGAPSSINRMIFPGTEQKILQEEMAETSVPCDIDGIIGGHSGLPFARLLDDRLWLNAGALGMPANDGTPRVWYCLIKAKSQGLAISFHSLEYDHHAAAALMREAGLKSGYADCLVTGLWPSLDQLGEEDRKRTGQALSPLPLFWPASQSFSQAEQEAPPSTQNRAQWG